MCPIIGEIRLYELSRSNDNGGINTTFSQYTKTLYNMFRTKNLAVPFMEEQMTLEDYKSII
jgi:hypothetical protein